MSEVRAQAQDEQERVFAGGHRVEQAERVEVLGRQHRECDRVAHRLVERRVRAVPEQVQAAPEHYEARICEINVNPQAITRQLVSCDRS